MLMAIAEFNERPGGGVLGRRRVETIHIDTETTPMLKNRQPR